MQCSTYTKSHCETQFNGAILIALPIFINININIFCAFIKSILKLEIQKRDADVAYTDLDMRRHLLPALLLKAELNPLSLTRTRSGEHL